MLLWWPWRRPGKIIGGGHGASRAALEDAKAQRAEVTRIARRLRLAREDNHFSQALADLFRDVHR